MNFISGGYYFSQGKEPPEWSNTALLPKIIWSTARDISDVFPDAWAFTTTGNEQVQREKKIFMDLLDMNASEFAEMEKFFDSLYFQKRCGWPNVIYDLPTARIIYQNYFFRLQNLKLLGLGLPSSYFDEFVKETVSPSQYLKSDLRYKVLKMEPPSLDGTILGFDVLGYDGGFWSIVAQGFESELSQNSGIHLNSYGLIDNIDEAARALDYVKTHNPEEGVWFFWQVTEYSPKIQ